VLSPLEEQHRHGGDDDEQGAHIARCSVPTTAGAASANGVSQTAGVPSRVSSRRPMATRPTATPARFSANQSRRKVQKSGETRPAGAASQERRRILENVDG